MDLRQGIYALILCGATLAAVHEGYSRPVDLSAPSNSIGAANLRGCVEIWREVDEIDLGKDLVLPLRFKFSSEKGVRGLLGEGFWCPLIEAHSVLVRPMMMKVNLLCGKTLYLRRDRKDKNKFQTLDQEWTGILNGRNFKITRDDGWALEFLDGRLSSLTTDSGRKLKWTFNGTQPAGIYEGANTVLRVEIRGDEVSIYSGVRRGHVVTLSKRPNFNVVQKQVVLDGFSPCLDSWRLPDQKVEQFAFALTDDQIPNLTFVDREQAKTVYTWDPATGHIRTENDWSYQITPVPERFGVPKVTRSIDGKKEGISIDNALGIYVKQNLDGTETITHTVHNPGPNYGKVLKSVRRERGTETILYTASYDELGRLIRSVNEKGFITTYTFDENGKFLGRMTKGPTDESILGKLALKEKALLESVTAAKSESLRGDALQTLGFFYIHEVGNPQKALDLLSRVTNRQQRFNLIFHAIDNRGDFSGHRKAEEFTKLLSEFPEQRELLEILIKTRKEADGHLERIISSGLKGNLSNLPAKKESK